MLSGFFKEENAKYPFNPMSLSERRCCMKATWDSNQLTEPFFHN